MLARLIIYSFLYQIQHGSRKYQQEEEEEEYQNKNEKELDKRFEKVYQAASGCLAATEIARQKTTDFLFSASRYIKEQTQEKMERGA